MTEAALVALALVLCLLAMATASLAAFVLPVLRAVARSQARTETIVAGLVAEVGKLIKPADPRDDNGWEEMQRIRDGRDG